MKWLIVPVLWFLAACLALFVLYRLWRGKPVVLRGRYSPRLVRMVVIVLVILGVGVTKKPGPGFAAPLPVKPDPADAALPEALTPEVIGEWLGSQQATGWFARLKLGLVTLEQAKSEKERTAAVRLVKALAASLPEAAKALILAEVNALEVGKPIPSASAFDLLAAVAALEKAGLYDHWLNSHLWRRTADRDVKEDKRTVELLFMRLEQHARLTNTLIRAQARVRPVYQPPRAWMSKAGPPKGWQAGDAVNKEALADLLKAAKELHASSDTGTWKRDGIAVLKVGKDSGLPRLLRGGKKRLLSTEESVRLGRLDLLETLADEKPVQLEHAWLGTITLPVGRLLSVWELSRQLPEEAKEKARRTIKAALDNDEDAADKLEQALPLVHSLLRDELKAAPTAKGAPRLRLILSLFDDAVMPALAPPATTTPGEELGAFPDRGKR